MVRFYRRRGRGGGFVLMDSRGRKEKERVLVREGKKKIGD